MIDVQFFVPWWSFLIPFGIAAFGACLLITSGVRCGSLLAVSAFPIGAPAVALVQLICLVLGVAQQTLLILIAVFAVTGLLAIIRVCGQSLRPRIEIHRWSQRFVFIGAIFSLLIGVFIVQSCDLGTSDPVWQWAFRAKVIAAESSLSSPFFSDSAVFHVNRGYPLLFSCLEAVYYRIQGDMSESACLRTITFGYFATFVACLVYLIWNRGWIGAMCMVSALSIPFVWFCGLDNVFVDFPMGVTAMVCVLWLMEEKTSLSSMCSGFFLSAGIAGFKQEGYVLIGTICISTVLMLRNISIIHRLLKLAPILCAAFLLFGIQKVQRSYLPKKLSNSNVIVTDMTPLDTRGFEHILFVWRYFAEKTLELSSFGVFFGIVAGALPWIVSSRARIPLAVSALYLSIIITSFAFILVGGSPAAPLEWSSARVLIQVIPMLSLALCLAIPVTQK